MLTPEQIKNHKFRSAGKGLYRSEDVDAFFEEAVEAFQKMQDKAAETQKNNDELYQRVEALANALNQMRAERELIQKTMILAQRAADDLTAKAQEESARLQRDSQQAAESARREAREEAASVLSGAKADVEKLLLEAQAHAENLQARAKAKADKLFEEARSMAQQELTRISAETQREQQELARLRREGMKFRNEMLDAVAKQMELIEQMPDYDEPEPEPEPRVARPESKIKLKAQPEPEPEPEPEQEAAEPEQEQERMSGEGTEPEPLDPFAELAAALEEPASSEFEEGFHFV